MNSPVLDRLLGRKGLIGERLIMGGFVTRRRFLALRKHIHKQDLRERKAEAARIAEDRLCRIDRDVGYRILENKTFEDVAEVTSSALEMARGSHLEELDQGKKPQRLAGLLDQENLRLDSPVLKLALRKDVVAAVSDYLRLVPILVKADIWYSKWASDTYRSSQLHHCDWEAERQLKVFVYATDVGAQSGPLVVLDAKQSENLRRRIGYKYGKRIRDEKVAASLDHPEETVCTGKRGTIVFADTAYCFHYGSRVGEECSPRIVAMLQFVPPNAFNLPLDFRNGAPFAHLAEPDMPKYQKMILGKI